MQFADCCHWILSGFRMIKNVLVALAAVSAIYVVFLKDSVKPAPAVSSAQPDYLIPETRYRKDEFPFDQVVEERLPGKIAGLWRTVERKRSNYIYIGIDGVKTRYSMRESGCLTVLGPDTLKYYGDGKYLHTSRHGHRVNLAFDVERTAMVGREIQINGPVYTWHYERMTDLQPEELPVCSRRAKHPYRAD